MKWWKRKRVVGALVGLACVAAGAVPGLAPVVTEVACAAVGCL